MCCCGKPTINGEPGYKWNQPDGPASVHPVNPPPLENGDALLFDEPGRCGPGLDSHCHHYRLVKNCGISLLYQHGGGNGRIRISSTSTLLEAFGALDSNARYWIFNAIYHAQDDAASDARDRERATWQRAAAQKRIKTRKLPARGTVKVWIEAEASSDPGPVID
jgi:hypothetical protein